MKKYQLNIILALVTGGILLTMEVLQILVPAIILPDFSVPNLVLVSLIALVADYFLAPGGKRCWVCMAVCSALCFGLFPLLSGILPPPEALKAGILGCAVFLLCGWLFGSLVNRLSSGAAGKAAAVAGAAGLYLAAQCFMGIV